MPGQEYVQMSADVLQKLQEEMGSFLDQLQHKHLDMDGDDAGVFQASLQFRSCPEETYIVVCAVHKNPRHNSLTRIKCQKGTPLGGYPYDQVNDAYCVECIDHLALGVIPISFKAHLGSWSCYVPLPEPLILKYMNEQQRQNLAQYKANFPADEYRFEFIQLLH